MRNLAVYNKQSRDVIVFSLSWNFVIHTMV